MLKSPSLSIHDQLLIRNKRDVFTSFTTLWNRNAPKIYFFPQGFYVSIKLNRVYLDTPPPPLLQFQIIGTFLSIQRMGLDKTSFYQCRDWLGNNGRHIDQSSIYHSIISKSRPSSWQQPQMSDRKIVNFLLHQNGLYQHWIENYVEICKLVFFRNTKEKTLMFVQMQCV